MRVAIYCRVSTDEQRERETIKTQREACVRECEANQFTIHEIYEDDGVTGTIALGERPAGARLLEDGARGLFDTVLIYNTKRLGRDARHILNAVYEMERLGLTVKSVTEPLDLATPAGKFTFAIFAGAAGFDRDAMVEVSKAASNRLAFEGQWMGGIVPYGYKVVGKNRKASLLISEEPLPGLNLSEADVIRLIYRMSADEGKSCAVIADHLNSLGVPPAFTRDSRLILRESTRGVWRYGRIRDMLTNTTYKGVHFYGKRSKKKREKIERKVPKIVEPEVWEGAQETLRRNRRFNVSHAKRLYLLRGLIKCELCGLTYVGTGYEVGRKSGVKKGAKERESLSGKAPGDQEPPGKVFRIYYVCNGKHNKRGPLGAYDGRCPAKSIVGEIEDVVWHDVQSFLRDPGAVLQELQARRADRKGDADQMQAELDRFRCAEKEKSGERDRVVTLWRKKRITDSDLDAQLDAIEREERALHLQIEGLERQLDASATRGAELSGIEQLLRDINTQLDSPLSWKTKRNIIVLLVSSIGVQTVQEDGKDVARVFVTYRFEQNREEQEEVTSRLARQSLPRFAAGSHSINSTTFGPLQNGDAPVSEDGSSSAFTPTEDCMELLPVLLGDSRNKNQSVRPITRTPAREPLGLGVT